MNKLAVTLGLIFLGALVWVVTSLDNSPRPPILVQESAWNEWQDMDPVVRDMICDIYVVNVDGVKASMHDEGLTEMEIEARFEIMERECK